MKKLLLAVLWLVMSVCLHAQPRPSYQGQVLISKPNTNEMRTYLGISGSGGGVGVNGAGVATANFTNSSSVTFVVNGSNITAVAASTNGGTVTSVALTAPAQFTVTGSPVTAAGTLGFSWANVSSNKFFAGPINNAVDAVPDFRVLSLSDFNGGSGATANTLWHGNGTWGAVSLSTDVSGDLPFSSLAQGSALSVLGVTGNSTADNASIAAGTDNQVFRRSGTSVGFGQVNLASSDAVTGTLLAAQAPAFTGDATTSAGSLSTTVGKVQGVAYSSTAPTQGQLYRYNAATSQMEATTLAELQPCLAVAVANVASLSGTTTIDGVSLGAGSRVLLTAQSTASQNGPWQINAGAWTRPATYAAGQSVAPSASVSVAGGTVYANSFWQLTGTTTSITVDTTSTTWGQLFPKATTSVFGLVKPDGTTITISGGVISSSGGGGGTVGTVVNVGTPAVGDIYSYGDTTGTNAVPNAVSGTGRVLKSLNPIGTNLTVYGSSAPAIYMTGGFIATNDTTGNWEVYSNGVKAVYITNAAAGSAFSSLVLSNSKPATSGNQSYSPWIEQWGNVYNTTGATSGPAGFKFGVIPTQAAIGISSLLWSNLSNGSWTKSMELNYQGILTTASSINLTTGSLNVNAGSVNIANSGYLGTLGNGGFTFPANGVITLNNIAFTGFTRLNFGGTTTSFPSLTRNGTALQVTLADGTYTTAAGFDVPGTITANTFVVTNAVTIKAGGTLSMSSGTNQRAGNATMVAGTVTVNNTTVTANTVVMLTRKTTGGTIGTAITYTTSAATSFTINSDNPLDTSTFSYMLLEVP